MSNVPSNFSPDYWKSFSPGKTDLEFISNYLFENELPLTEKELVPVVVGERIRAERENLQKQRQGSGKVYLPKMEYKVGDTLVFPALDWKEGKVVGTRPGINPGQGKFLVIDVDFQEGRKSFACVLENHKLNAPQDIVGDEPGLNLNNVLEAHGPEIEQKLGSSLNGDKDLVRIAGRWFPKVLLMDVNVGHLNLAEAVLEEAGGTPLPAEKLIEQVDLPKGSNSKLMEFSMNYALQEDGRFDEVGPAGEVLWCLKRTEPEDVQKIPAVLRYSDVQMDLSLLTPQMLKLVDEIDDELSQSDKASDLDEVTVSLTYPHWRAGTLPVSAHVRGLLPTAYESPRVRFTLLDEENKQEIPAWVVRKPRYVAGLADFYKKHEMFPGGLLKVKRGKKPGQVIISAKTRRPMRDWVRTVLVGSDGGIVFAMLKQNLAVEYNERMVIAVPDVAGVDDACAQMAKQHISFDQNVTTMMRELVKLNVQGHVHAQELYSALNIIRRCPPAPLLAFLVSQPGFKHVGDMHFRMSEKEAGDE